MATDAQQVTLLAMLDSSAAFYCVHHSIILQRLQFGAALTEVALKVYLVLSVRTELADRL